MFGLPDLEISPRRHLIVSHCAGGWTLGAFVQGQLVGFVHHLAAVKGDYIFGYSHMMAVAAEYQNKGVGAQLKWAQRKRALSEGRDFIKWTFEPMRARNAHFNLNRLGVVIKEYAVNFTALTIPGSRREGKWVSGMTAIVCLPSWELRSPRVEAFAQRMEDDPCAAERAIEILPTSSALPKSDPEAAKREVLRCS